MVAVWALVALESVLMLPVLAVVAPETAKNWSPLATVALVVPVDTAIVPLLLLMKFPVLTTPKALDEADGIGATLFDRVTAVPARDTPVKVSAVSTLPFVRVSALFE